MAPLLRKKVGSTKPQDGVKVAFKDAHYKDGPREKARIVEIHLYDKGNLVWRVSAPIMHVEEGLDMLTRVSVECKTEGCAWNGSVGGIDLFERHKVPFVTHRDEICEHMWNRFKSEVDEELKSAKGGESPSSGTTRVT